MPFDFPANPSNGQAYGGYIWNAANSSWDSAYAPRAATVPLTGANPVLNAAMDIWQRGTSFASEQYNADRWYGTNLAGTWSRESTVVPAGFRYAMKFVASASGAPYLMQPMETAVAYPYAGKTVTLSAYMATSASRTSTIAIQYSDTVDNAQTNAWTTIVASSGGSGATSGSVYSRITGVYNIPSSAKSLRIYGTVGSTVSGDIVYMTGFQIDVGVAPTDFHTNQPTIATELAACQRYYQRIDQTEYESAFGLGVQTSSTTGNIFIPLPVALRVVPTSISLSQVGVGDKSIWSGAATITSYNMSTKVAANINVTYASNGAQWRPLYMQGRGSAPYNSYVEISAEL